MTRAILAVSLWSLCGLVGLYTARLIALNVESEQRLEDKRADLLWKEEVNSGLSLKVEAVSLDLEEGLRVGDEEGDGGGSR